MRGKEWSYQPSSLEIIFEEDLFPPFDKKVVDQNERTLVYLSSKD